MTIRSAKSAILAAAFLLAHAWAPILPADALDPSAPAAEERAYRAAEQRCREHLWSVHGATGTSQSRILFEETLAFQVLAEQSLAYREESIRVADRLKRQSGQGRPLSGADLDLLNSGMAAHLALREALYAVAESHECWLQGTEDILGQLSITPGERLQGIMLSLAAALVLYDNYLLAISLFEEDTKLRRLLNLQDSGYGIEGWKLAEVTTSFHSSTKRARARRGIDYYERNIDAHLAAIERQPHLRYLNQLIGQSPSYSRIKRRTGMLPDVLKGLQMFGVVTLDTVQGLRGETTGLFSMLFGNTAGLVETRRGKLFDRPEIREELSKMLRPGDILLERTPFRLTDLLIPGYWGHVAIWLGTEPELVALGVWDHPVAQAHQEAIRAGSGVVEALRSGVQLNTLEHFLNVDDLAVLRRLNESDARRAERLTLTLRQVGKPYDFNFDVETTNRIVCSELVYQTFTDITWPTESVLGRSAISPDHILEKLFDGGELEVVILYLDGRKREADRVESLRRLTGDASPAENPD